MLLKNDQERSFSLLQSELANHHTYSQQLLESDQPVKDGSWSAVEVELINNQVAHPSFAPSYVKDTLNKHEIQPITTTPKANLVPPNIGKPPFSKAQMRNRTPPAHLSNSTPLLALSPRRNSRLQQSFASPRLAPPRPRALLPLP